MEGIFLPNVFSLNHIGVFQKLLAFGYLQFYLKYNSPNFFPQFLPLRGKCLQGKSCQVPVCGLYGHLPLPYQNRWPAVWRSTGSQNVRGYRLGELFSVKNQKRDEERLE